MNFDYKYAIAYHSDEPFIDQEIVMQGRLHPLVRPGEERQLSYREVKRLNEIVSRPEPRGEYVVIECFEPRHGVVFWDESDRPVAWLSICFQCQKVVGRPEVDKSYVKDLEVFFEDLQLLD